MCQPARQSRAAGGAHQTVNLRANSCKHPIESQQTLSIAPVRPAQPCMPLTGGSLTWHPSAGAAQRMQAEAAQLQACTFSPAQQQLAAARSPSHTARRRGRLHKQLPLQRQVCLAVGHAPWLLKHTPVLWYGA